MKIIKGFINSNIFISLGAVFLTIETQVQLQIGPQWHPYLFLIFFATLFEYNLHRLVTVLTNKEALNSEKHVWVRDNLTLFYLLVALSVAGFAVAVSMARREVLLTLAPIALLTLFYSTPVTPLSRGLFRLRQLPFIKIFLISFVWAAVTIALPVIHSKMIHPAYHIAALFIERFLFIFAITIPFDIRDLEADRKSGLKTLPSLFGPDKSMMLSSLSLVAFSILAIVHYIYTGQLYILVAMLVSAATTAVFLTNRRLQQFPLYHYGILDGTILLQGILVLAAYYLH